MPSIDPNALLQSGHCMNPGDVVDGRYRITGLIGEGTFAYVYRANHLVISTLQVAIKVLKPSFVADEELRQQFVLEAETVAILRNRHTVRITDLGRMPDGRPYIAMEYAAGLTLNQILRLYGPLNTAFIALVADGVLRSLREAHEMGVIHRDIKPSNVIVTRDLEKSHPLVRVLDFGIAHTIQSHSVESDESSSNFVFCTPSYAAPEVLHGRPSKSADFYALGLTLAELIEGEPVYPNIGFYKVAEQQTSSDPVPFGKATRQNLLFPLIQRACHKEPYRRYATANEMLDDLMQLTQHIDPQSLFSTDQPAPIGCSVPKQCSIRNNNEVLSRAAICPNPQCNLRLNAPSSATELADFDTLQAALNMDLDDLNFDLDAFTDTEVHPRIPGSTPQDTRTQDVQNDGDADAYASQSTHSTGRFLGRPLPDDDDADDATYHTHIRVRGAESDVSSPFSEDGAPDSSVEPPLPISANTPAQNVPATKPSFLALQRTLFSRASGRRRTAWNLVCGVFLLSTLIYLLFAGLPSLPQ